MRIALCLSGQPRGLPVCLEIIKASLIEPNGGPDAVDVFFHAWHDESQAGKPYNSAQPSQNGRVGIIKANTEKLLVEGLKPKKFIVEPQRDFPHLRNLKSDPTANQELLGSNFYSVYMANKLKKQHEQENGILYDVVIRTRYDLFYFNPVRVSDYTNNFDKIVVMEEFQNHQDWKNNPDKPMVDIFSFGNSKNMDVFSSVYPHMESLNKQIDPPFGENYLGRHVRINGGVELYKAPLKLQILHRIVDLNGI